MDRRKALTRFVNRKARGIEIGPWCNPIAPKRSGYNCLVLDVFDTQTLRKRAIEDSGLTAKAAMKIEDVDLVGSSTDIADLVRARKDTASFDYIVSSHNFEHIPNPIKFLQGAEAVLNEDGVLTMAIPDKRACFDYFRPVSALSEMLSAYFEGRERPTQAQIFQRWSLHARQVLAQGKEAISFPMNTNPEQIVPFYDLQQAFQAWDDFVTTPDEVYRDTHCWVFTPASCELILTDLLYLGLTNLSIVEITPLGSTEFCVHLKKHATSTALTKFRNEKEYQLERTSLLHRINDELSAQSASSHGSKQFKQDLTSSELISEFQVLSGIARELPAAQRVIVFAPHPDDEIFGCGGTLSILQSQGGTISPVIITDGEKGIVCGDVTAIRQKESCRAAHILGFEEPIFLGLPDRGLACNDELTNCLLEQITMLQPNLVFLPAPTELHPDHQAVALAGSAAMTQYGQGRVIYYEVGSPLPTPNMLIDITGVSEKKKQAMECFASQIARQPYDKQVAGLNCFRAYSLESEALFAEAFVSVDFSTLDEGIDGVFDWPLAYRRVVTDRTQLQKVISEWEGWIAGLEQVAIERENRLTEQNGRIAELENVIAEWEPWISGLQQVIVERDKHISSQQAHLDVIYNSSSWRVTAPLRHVMEKIYRLRRWIIGLIT